MSFSSDMARFNKKVEKRLNIVFTKVAFDISERVILRTPVDTGRARGNWIPAINRFSTGQIGSTDPQGTSAISRVKTEAEKGSIGDKFTLVNNLPYIGKLESGDHSKQAPAGMVAISVAEFRSIVSKAVKAARAI